MTLNMGGPRYLNRTIRVASPVTNTGTPEQPIIGLDTATVALVAQLGTDSGWQNFSYAANWSNFGAPAATGQYKKDALGWVCLKGSVKKSAALALPDTIATLPTGFRPATEHAFSVGSAGGYTRVIVDTAGLVYILNGGSATATNLDGIRFEPST